MENFVRFEHVYKTYGSGDAEVAALKDACFTIDKGEIVVILGQSGAGKTTLLNILGGMDTLTSGKVFLENEEVSAYQGKQLARYRREDIGFVFQFYNLIPNLTALENVELAAQIVKDSIPAQTVLEQVGLGHRTGNFPAQLSGGEQQRVSIARALCKNPALLLCDEPTGALDSKTGLQVLSLLKDVSEKYQTTVAIITHNAAIAPLARRVIRVKNGQIESVTINDHPASVDEIAW